MCCTAGLLSYALGPKDEFFLGYVELFFKWTYLLISHLFLVSYKFMKCEVFLAHSLQSSFMAWVKIFSNKRFFAVFKIRYSSPAEEFLVSKF